MTTITFVPWDTTDPHPVRSTYVERCWLPIIGPSALMVARIAATELDHGNWDVHWADLAAMVGLTGKTGPNSVVVRSVNRLVSFGLAAVPQADPFAVALKLRWRALGPANIRRLPIAARDIHDTHTTAVAS